MDVLVPLNSDIEHISEVLHRQVKQKEDTETDALSLQSLSLTETGIGNDTKRCVLKSGSHKLSFPMHLLLDAEGFHIIRSTVHILLGICLCSSLLHKQASLIV